MATRLKDRNKGIPNGLRFNQPELNFTLRGKPSFTQAVGQIYQARLGNKYITEKNRLSLDLDTIGNELDLFNTRICIQHGWTQYLTMESGAEPPKQSPPPSLLQLGKRLVAGAETIAVEWIATGAEAVPVHQAEQRARTCVLCPLNKRGDLLSFFTVPVANAVRAAISLKHDWNLKTSADDHLGVCQACSCPLRLKVWLPLDKILARMPKESFDELDTACWIRSENKV